MNLKYALMGEETGGEGTNAVVSTQNVGLSVLPTPKAPARHMQIAALGLKIAKISLRCVLGRRLPESQPTSLGTRAPISRGRGTSCPMGLTARCLGPRLRTSMRMRWCRVLLLFPA